LQVQTAIARAHVAYKDSLDVKANALGEPERNFKAEIGSAITSLGGAANQEIKKAGDRAQVIADKLRLPGGAPQVRSFGPIFLFPFLPFQSVNVGGSFPVEYPNGAIPQLTVNGKSYKALGYEAQSLTFSVRTVDLDAAEPEAIVWRKGELTIPWNKPMFDPFSRVGYENFVVIGVLPHSFGRAAVEHRTNTVRREEKARLSDDFLPDSNPGGMEESRCLTLSPQELSDGWRVKAGSGAFVSKVRIEGESNIDRQDLGLQSENDRSICWRVRAIHGADGYTAAQNANSSGEMAWSISAMIWRDVNDSAVASEEIDLAWGSRHAFAYAAGTWKLRYSKFGGSPTEVQTADVSNPLVRINSDGHSVTISTYPF
jgi:hypothetical protein